MKLIKNLLKKTLIYKYFDSNFIQLNEKYAISAYENQLLANENIDLRLKIKKINQERINVVFVCHRPAVWESLRTVYEALKRDELFNVSIVAIPNKKELPGVGLNHEIYESEGAEEFWKEYGCINGYNYETKEWLDLKSLNPDYIFFQQPYNITRHSQYKSWVVSKYAKLLYVPYGLQTIGGEVFESVHPADFMKNVSYYFSPDKYDYRDLTEWFSRIHNGITKLVISGFPRFDHLKQFNESDDSIWRFKNTEKKFRIIWTPRWCTNEGTCTFFEYKDKILEYAIRNKDVEIIFRPHPQAFLEWTSTGEMTTEEQHEFRKQCEQIGIIIDEEGEYLSKIKTTDCFITDVTSLMGEYILTGKPVIYCYKKDCLTEYGKTISKGFYYTHNWDEVECCLDEVKSGQDSYREKRLDIIKEEFYLPMNGAGDYICSVIKEDALK